MPRVIYTDQANRDLVRLAQFLREKDPELGKRVVVTILEGIGRLQALPTLGKSAGDDRRPYLRELKMRFGAAGYVALYEYTPDSDTVTIAAVRHFREAGYKADE